MASVGVTGGVATGKSTVARQLLTFLELKCAIDHFDADFEARRLTDQDSVVKEEIRSAFGIKVFSPDGNLSRERLRDLVFHDLAARKTLESILHPRIRAAWIDRLRTDRLLVAEIPLLYETRAERFLDCIIVIACSRASQVKRLIKFRGLSEVLSQQIISAQMPLEDKINRADHLIWTDCRSEITELQTKRLAEGLIERYGGVGH